MSSPETNADETSVPTRDRFGLLLGALVISFLIQGIAKEGAVSDVALAVMLGATLTLALWAADARGLVLWLGAAVAFGVIVVTFVGSVMGHVGGVSDRLSNLLLVLLAPPAVVVGVVRSVRARQAITIEAVFGTLCLYLLLGMGFAFTYGAIWRLTHTFFVQTTQPNASTFLYFSFTTLTTVGYGDFTAKTQLGHTLSVSEALAGQIYLVTIVSMIVANLTPRRRVLGDRSKT